MYTLASYMHIYVYIRRFIYIINIYIKGVYQTSSELKAKARGSGDKERKRLERVFGRPGTVRQRLDLSRAILGFFWEQRSTTDSWATAITLVFKPGQ